MGDITDLWDSEQIESIEAAQKRTIEAQALKIETLYSFLECALSLLDPAQLELYKQAIEK